MSMKALRPLLCIHSVEFDDNDGLIILRRKLRNHVSRLEKDKQREDDDVERDFSYHRREATKDEARRAWPRRISEDVKNCVRQMFGSRPPRDFGEFCVSAERISSIIEILHKIMIRKPSNPLCKCQRNIPDTHCKSHFGLHDSFAPFLFGLLFSGRHIDG